MGFPGVYVRRFFRRPKPGSPEDIIAKTEKRFPMPEGELQRLAARSWILGLIPPGGIGAEIGVFRGHFSDLICRVARPRHLYLIDPWTTLGPTFGWGSEYTNFDSLTTEAAREQARASVARHKHVTCTLIEGMYPTCKDRIVHPLDFAYIDSSHHYCPTLDELRHLSGQVRNGGLILGDDWYPDPQAQHHGVFRAVQDFVAETDWQIIAAGPGMQWAIRRPTGADTLPGSGDFIV